MCIPNGAAFATKRDVLFEKNLIITNPTGIHIMSLEKSIDIDEPIDFKIAEFIAQHQDKIIK
jgi:CMP-N-acetylneuraminic acid synthetase